MAVAASYVAVAVASSASRLHIHQTVAVVAVVADILSVDSRRCVADCFVVDIRLAADYFALGTIVDVADCVVCHGYLDKFSLRRLA